MNSPTGESPERMPKTKLFKRRLRAAVSDSDGEMPMATETLAPSVTSPVKSYKLNDDDNKENQVDQAEVFKPSLINRNTFEDYEKELGQSEEQSV